MSPDTTNQIAAKESTAQKEEPLARQLVGVWQAAPMMGAGWAETYQFFHDGKFTFNIAQADCEARERARTGTWQHAKGKLMLRATHRTVIEGGSLEPSLGSCSTAQEIVGGTPRTESLARVKEESLPLAAVEHDAGNNRPTIRLGDKQFWKYDDDPRRYP